MKTVRERLIVSKIKDLKHAVKQDSNLLASCYQEYRNMEENLSSNRDQYIITIKQLQKDLYFERLISLCHTASWMFKC